MSQIIAHQHYVTGEPYTTNAMIYNVALITQCLLYCLQDNACSSFFYNPVQRACFTYGIIYIPASYVPSDWQYFSLYNGYNCPGGNGYLSPRNIQNCYKVYNTPRVTYDDARQLCAAEGATLLRIDTADKQNFISESLGVSGEYKNIDYHFGIQLFQNQFNDAYMSTWRWPDGSDVIYSNFPAGEIIHIGEYCVELNFAFAYKWNVMTCGELGGFICELT